MPGDFDLNVGVRDERSRDDIENRVRIGFERGATRLERHTAQHDGRPRFGEQDGAAGRVHLGTWGGAGAFVLGIVYAVAVRVGRALAADAIDLGPRWRIRALIDAVRHAVVVRVGRAPLRVDSSAGRSSGTLVDAVIDAVAIRILGATARVHFGALHRVRTGIEAVIDTVAVGVARTSLRVYRGAGRRAGALVVLIGDPVQVRIAKAARPCEDRQPR